MEFKENAEIIDTSDFWYDLFDGGYIEPEKLLINEEDIEKINNAIKILKRFNIELENKGLINLI